MSLIVKMRVQLAGMKKPIEIAVYKEFEYIYNCYLLDPDAEHQFAGPDLVLNHKFEPLGSYFKITSKLLKMPGVIDLIKYEVEKNMSGGEGIVY